MATAKQSNYAVLLKASSGTRINPEKPFIIRKFPSSTGLLDILFYTLYADEGYSVRVPRELYIDVRGKSDSLKDAINSFYNVVLNIVPVISFSANSSINNPEVLLAYDKSKGIYERDYFQNFLPDEKGMFRQGRELNNEATTNLIISINRHPEIRRILRAIRKYHEALLYWKPEEEIQCLALLYMGVETLTKAVLKEECKKSNCTEDELVKKWKIDKKELDSQIRLKNIFNSNTDCYKKAKKASDGLEHGFLELDKIYKLSKETRDKTAKYLRNSILNLLELGKEHYDLLTSDLYNTVCESYKISSYLWGKFHSHHPHLGSEGHEHPIIIWERKIKNISLTSGGKYNVNLDQNFKLKCSEYAKFTPSSYEVWGRRAIRSSYLYIKGLIY